MDGIAIPANYYMLQQTTNPYDHQVHGVPCKFLDIQKALPWWSYTDNPFQYNPLERCHFRPLTIRLTRQSGPVYYQRIPTTDFRHRSLHGPRSLPRKHIPPSRSRLHRSPTPIQIPMVSYTRLWRSRQRASTIRLQNDHQRLCNNNLSIVSNQPTLLPPPKSQSTNKTPKTASSS